MKNISITRIPKTDEEAEAIFDDSSSPSEVAARGLYKLYRAKGDSILEALEKVFRELVAAHEPSSSTST